MKKSTALLLVMLLLSSCFSALAATEIPSVLKRNIQLQRKGADGTYAANPPVPGESPVTGLPKALTDYTPILVQIDNNSGALPQWGIGSADIMYEMPIAGQGLTRLTALFSDRFPTEAGPVRSGRVMHADLREEWDALLIYYGMQEDAGSDMGEALKKHGANRKGLAADGMANKFANVVTRVRYHKAPHNVSVNIEAIKNQFLPQGYAFPLRPFLFKDDTNYGSAGATTFNVIHRGNKDTSSTFTYNANSNTYTRATIKGNYVDFLFPETPIQYSNVLIQRTKLSWNNSSSAPLFNDIVGSGAADLFIAGQYIPGAWARSSMQSRTVFFDQNGNEIALQRGKTWIIVCDENTQVIVGDLDPSMASVFTNTAVVDETVPAAPVEPVPNAATQQEGPASQGSAGNLATAQTGGSKGNNLSADSAPADTNSGNSATVTIKGGGMLNMREAADKASSLITRIPNGAKVAVLSTDDQWTHIQYDGKDGYVMSTYLTFQGDFTNQVISQQGSSVSANLKELKLGDRGDAVLQMKKRLYDLGYFRTTQLNNRYMESTSEAVRAFEERNGLGVDGVADTAMLELLYSSLALSK